MKISDHKIIFKAVVGSHSFGTNVEGSDIDHAGVYIQTPKDVLYNGYVPQIQVSKDEMYYEVGRFLSLCETANPGMLELLYTPDDCIVYKDPIWDLILEKRAMFITKRCRLSFGGYAVEQLIKARSLEKKMNWERERVEKKDLLEFCFVRSHGGSINIREFLKSVELQQEQIGLVALPHMRYCYGVYWNLENKWDNFKPNGIARDLLLSNDVSTSVIPSLMEGQFPHDVVMYFNKDAYSSHCKEHREYQEWLKNRNTQRYVDVESHGQKIDGKNISHCVRLLDTAIEIPISKTVNVRRPNPTYLVNIRKGKLDLNNIVASCEMRLRALDKLFTQCNLPEHAYPHEVKRLTIQVREAFANQKETNQQY